MKPRSPKTDPQSDLFKLRLEDLCDPSHALCKVSKWINWEALEKEVSESFATIGAPGLPVRLMAGLMYLQHAYGVSDERVLVRVDGNRWCFTHNSQFCWSGSSKTGLSGQPV